MVTAKSGGPSRLVLCCLQPVLNPERDEEYYVALGVSRSASGEEIKRAFRSVALRQHPDKRAQRNEVVTEADIAEFQRVKEAYECLSEPKRRKIYDALGALGTKWYENPSTASPDAVMRKVAQIGDRCRCAILSFIFLAVAFFFLYLPVLLALRVDGVADVPFAVVALPLWLVDIFGLANAVGWVLEGTTCRQPSQSQSPQEGAPPAADEEAAHRAAPKGKNDDDDRDDDEQEDFDPFRDETPLRLRCLALLRASLFVAFQILLVVRLDGGDIDVAVVFAPLFLRELLALAELGAAALVAIPPLEDNGEGGQASATQKNEEQTTQHAPLEDRAQTTTTTTTTLEETQPPPSSPSASDDDEDDVLRASAAQELVGLETKTKTGNNNNKDDDATTGKNANSDDTTTTGKKKTLATTTTAGRRPRPTDTRKATTTTTPTSGKRRSRTRGKRRRFCRRRPWKSVRLIVARSGRSRRGWRSRC